MSHDDSAEPCAVCGNPSHVASQCLASIVTPASSSDVRAFATGAIRDLDDSKPDYEGFLSPLVIQAFGAYMHKHRKTAAGLRDSDNWQKGFPLPVLVKSAMRHFVELWAAHRRGEDDAPATVDAALALLFNVQAYLHQILQPAKKETKP